MRGLYQCLPEILNVDGKRCDERLPHAAGVVCPYGGYEMTLRLVDGVRTLPEHLVIHRILVFAPIADTLPLLNAPWRQLIDI